MYPRILQLNAERSGAARAAAVVEER